MSFIRKYIDLFIYSNNKNKIVHRQLNDIVITSQSFKLFIMQQRTTWYTCLFLKYDKYFLFLENAVHKKNFFSKKTDETIWKRVYKNSTQLEI